MSSDGRRDTAAVTVAAIVNLAAGPETFVVDQLDRLVQGGHRVLLVPTRWGRARPTRFGLVRPIPSVRSVGWLIRGFARQLTTALRTHTAGELLVGGVLAAQLRRNPPTVVYATFADRKLAIGFYIAGLLGTPLITAVHAHEVYAQPKPRFFPVGLARASAIMCISEHNADLVCQQVPSAAPRVHVIKLPVDHMFWDCRRPVTVLTVARATERKGFRTLFEAARILGAEFEFVTVGDGPLDLTQLARDAGCTNVINLGGLTPQAVRLMCRLVDIFCLPSHHTDEEGSEGIPVAILEALAMGLPVVTTPNGSISELAPAPVFVSERDPKALALALRQTASTLARRGVPTPNNRDLVLRSHGLSNHEEFEQLVMRVANEA